MAKEIELQQRTGPEINELYLKLMKFFLENPEFNWIEDSNGVHVVIPVLKVVEKSAIVMPKSPSIIK